MPDFDLAKYYEVEVGEILDVERKDYMEGKMEETKKCTVCGNEKIKKGKLTGIAALQSLKSRSSLSGSELIFTFCSECGEVLGIKVAKPEKIDYSEEIKSSHSNS